MFTHCFVCPPIATNSYLVACKQKQQAVVIDPGFTSSTTLTPLLAEQQLQLSAILLTHSHWDHIAEVAVLQEHYNVPVYLHPLDGPNLVHPGSDRLPITAPPIRGCATFQPLHDGQMLAVGVEELSVIHTPGHSPGSVCFYHAGTRQLFSGDTLFKGSIGNLSFPTSQPALMWPSLRKLAQLPSTTVVHAGHGATTTLAAENWLMQAEEIFG